MALDPRISLAAQPVNLQEAIIGGFEIGKGINNARNQGIRDAILKNEAASSAQELITGQQRQDINAQTIARNDVAADIAAQNEAITQANHMHKGLSRVASLPAEDLAGGLARMADIAASKPELGLDPQAILNIPPNKQAIQQHLAALGSFVNETNSKSLGQQEFEASIAGLSEEDKEKARRIKVGLDPRAVGSGARVETINGVPTFVDSTNKTAEEITVPRTQPDGTTTEEPVTLESTASGEATVAARTTAHKAAVAKSEKFFDSLPSMNEKLGVYDDIIQAVNDGASTGKVSNMFPSLKRTTIELDNLQKRLGLNVIQNTTFGSLSESELAFALDAALPKDLSGPDLIEWVENKKRVQQKLINYASEAAQYLGTGSNTISGWLELQKSRQAGSGSAQPAQGMSNEEADAFLQGFE